jgi:hypothetical protein
LVEADADEIVNAPKQREKTAKKDVKRIVKTLLRDGAKPTKIIEEALREAGIDPKFNWQRAAKDVAQSRQIKGQGKNAGWEWFLTTPEQADFDTTRPKEERLTA